MRKPGVEVVEEVVVVGVDGSESSARALGWAVDFATRHDCAVEVVTVWPHATAPMVHDAPGYCAPRDAAWTAQRRVLERISAGRGSLPRLHTQLLNARPVDALVSRSAGRRLLVVGSDRARPPGRDHDSIPARCDTLARCPVMVVREQVPPGQDHRH